MFNRISITGRLAITPKKTGDNYAFFYIHLGLGPEYRKTIGVETAGKTAAIVLEKCKKGDVVSIDGTLTYKDISRAETGDTYKNFYVQASTVCFFKKD